jgi:hypothetical protein
MAPQGSIGNRLVATHQRSPNQQVLVANLDAAPAPQPLNERPGARPGSHRQQHQAE